MSDCKCRCPGVFTRLVYFFALYWVLGASQTAATDKIIECIGLLEAKLNISGVSSSTGKR